MSIFKENYVFSQQQHSAADSERWLQSVLTEPDEYIDINTFSRYCVIDYSVYPQKYERRPVVRVEPMEEETCNSEVKSISSKLASEPVPRSAEKNLQNIFLGKTEQGFEFSLILSQEEHELLAHKAASGSINGTKQVTTEQPITGPAQRSASQQITVEQTRKPLGVIQLDSVHRQPAPQRSPAEWKLWISNLSPLPHLDCDCFLDKTVRCNPCLRMFENDSELHQHNKKQHSHDMSHMTCPLCKKVYRLPNDLKHHRSHRLCEVPTDMGANGLARPLAGSKTMENGLPAAGGMRPEQQRR